MIFQTGKLDKLIRTHMRKRHTPGMAISVLKDGQTLYSKGFGLRNLKQCQTMTADTLMGIGSISKSFAAFAVIKLQEMGKLSIEDSVADYLAFEPFLSRPEIKLKHLLSHSSGIPATEAGMLAFNYAFDNFSNIYPATHREDFIAHIADASDFIIFKPGEKFFYNNDMYTCLSFIVEQVSGMSFTDFVQQAILDPLGMTRSVYTQQGLDQDPNDNVMTGYRFESKNGKTAAKASDLPFGVYAPARGGLYTSMNEILKYAQCLINGGEYKGQRLLSPASVARLFKGLIPSPYGEGDKPTYALGWTVEPPTEQRPYTLMHHAGNLETSSAFFALIPELNLAVVAAENATTGITPLMVRAAIALVLDQVPQDELEPLQIDGALQEIQGMYKTAHDLYSLNIVIKGEVLQADFDDDDGCYSLSLTPKDLGSLNFDTYSLRSNNPRNLQFYRNKDSQKVEYAAYDRFLYRRV